MAVGASRNRACLPQCAPLRPTVAGRRFIGVMLVRRRGVGGKKPGAQSLTAHRSHARISGCFTPAPTGRTQARSGGIPKRPTGADCKSAGLRLRWFESTSLHQVSTRRSAARACEARTKSRGGGEDRRHGSTEAPEGAFERTERCGPEGEGSNIPSHPPPSTRFHQILVVAASRRGSSSTVEPQPSKLMVRVRFPSPAPLNDRSVVARFHCNDTRFHAHVAQSVEHLLGKEEVEGSIPFVSTIHAVRFTLLSNDPRIRSHGKG
jgi:hypothetical protein